MKNLKSVREFQIMSQWNSDKCLNLHQPKRISIGRTPTFDSNSVSSSTHHLRKDGGKLKVVKFSPGQHQQKEAKSSAETCHFHVKKLCSSPKMNKDKIRKVFKILSIFKKELIRSDVKMVKHLIFQTYACRVDHHKQLKF